VKSIKLTKQINTDFLVLGLAQNNGKLVIESGLTKFDEKKLLVVLANLGATGNADEVVKVPHTNPQTIIFTGLGKSNKTYGHETLRRAAGAASRALAGQKSATFALPILNSQDLAAVAEGAALGAYSFTEFRGSTLKDQKTPLGDSEILSKLDSIEAKNAIKRALVLAKNSFLIRDLINTPPSHLTPSSFAIRIKKIALTLGLKVEILDEKVLKSKGYGGITGVGQGSANPPRLLRISYKPAKARKHLALVGKGITFDTGGLALKPANGMEAMKCDMGGAAAVIATVLAAAELKLPIAIDAWAAMAENMISDNATRPSDIHTMYGGKTIEVLNPDAEGRLVMADALVKAQESKMKLDGIIDVATLTGAQVVALGTRTSAVMTNNDEFRAQFLVAADQAGEDFWPMPLPEELRASLDSTVADMANIGDRMGGMLVAGIFLKEFIPAELPWLHLDIAGPAYNDAKPHGYTPIGGTGIAFRSLIRLAEITSEK
jgi:leucyl aminopeptidase